MEDYTNPIIPYASPTSFRVCLPPWPRALACAVLLSIPEGFYRTYQVFNENWLVKRFGCGCPDVRTGRRPFPNANDISMCVYAVLALLLCIAVYLVLRSTLKRWPPTPAMVCIGVMWAIVGMWCLRGLGRGFWL